MDSIITTAAARLGIEPETIAALAQVESMGRSGFLADGKPMILYEPHVFSRNSGGRFDGSHPGLSYRRWKRGAYGKFSQQHAKLEAAAKLDPVAAAKACSWGRFQILGENHAACGFATVEAFVAAMQTPEGQLEAFIAFVAGQPKLVAALRDRDWATAARIYNGPGYAAAPGREADYDTKLAAAYAAAKARGGAAA